MDTLSQASRPLMWNIEPAWLMYALFGVALAVFGYGFYRRIAYWRRGKPDGERLGDWGRRFWLLAKELLLQRRVRGATFAGIFHSLIFYAFIVLAITTAVVALDYDFGTTLFSGYLYVGLTVAAELAGVLVLVGVGMAFWRRSVQKPAALTTTLADLWPLALIAGIVLTGFLIEGLRIHTIGDRWAYLSPVGYVAGLPFAGFDAGAARAAHSALWWTHTVLAFGWIAAIPYTKFFHLLALPTNVFFARLKPRGALQHVDVLKLMEAEDFDETQFNVGVAKTSDFTWKQRLDFDACISCGRCEAICPATQSGHRFSPKQFVATCRALLQGERPLGPADGAAAPPAGETEAGPPALVGDGFDENFIWYCRTCTACMEVCPATVDFVDTLMEVRRHEIMMEGRAPGDAMRALKMLENRGNPFGPQSDRVDWVKSLGVRVVAPGESCDVLYWVGCCTSFDPTKQKIASDLALLLDRCGIDFGVLGADERCCGDPARVLGDERLFQEVARQQIEALQQRSFRVLLTSCPHCYNVLKNEYPQFGANFHVVHHAEFLHEMFWTGELAPKIGVTRKVAFHDPCYLGRYQKVYEAPRQVIAALPGTTVSEMRDARERSLCCGGGGGHFWMDLKANERINNLRVRQAQDAGADTIVTACAFCKQMLEDSVKHLDLDDQIEVIDLASLVLQTLPPKCAAASGAEAESCPLAG